MMLIDTHINNRNTILILAELYYENYSEPEPTTIARILYWGFSNGLINMKEMALYAYDFRWILDCPIDRKEDRHV